jgi:serine/threonine-protein kinase
MLDSATAGVQSGVVPDPALASPFDPASLVGTTLDDRYVLSAHLATGGMGAVFRAHHVHLRKDVAVKVLRPDLTTSPEIVERFRREAEIASALEHDNIVRVTDFGRSAAGQLFLVMELLTGESLFERLRRRGFLPPEEAVPILWQVCAALEAAHAIGVVHRDLKPENVFLARTSSGREVAKILDFGIAKLADPGADGCTTQAGIVVGTPEYLAPEQAMGTSVDARADIYAVGLIAWRMLAGHHPFKADDARSLLMMQANRPVPPLTEAQPDLAVWPLLVLAVAKACEKEARDRQESAAALREDLQAALGPSFMMPPGATPAPSVSRSPSRPPVAPEGTPAYAATPPLAPVVPLHAPASGREPQGVARAAPKPPPPPRSAVAHVRRRPLLLAIAAALVAAAAVAAAIASGAAARREAPREAPREAGDAAAVRDLLARDRPADARTAVEEALRRRPDDVELLLLRARTLHRLPGRTADGIEAYAAARARGPLDAAAFDDLVADLGRERSLADRATRLLRDDPQGATPAVLRAASTAKGTHRLRALALARDLGAEERVDRVEAYGGLLGDPDCDVRRAAAGRLGELAATGAVSRLRAAAQAKVETKGFFGRIKRVPACGAAEAEAAIRRIKAARLPAAR